MVASRNCAWFSVGVMTETRGRSGTVVGIGSGAGCVRRARRHARPGARYSRGRRVTEDAGRVDARLAQVRLEHQANELVEGDRRAPAECLARLRGVAAQLVDLGRAEVALVDANVLLGVEPYQPERDVDELLDAVHLARRDQ